LSNYKNCKAIFETFEKDLNEEGGISFDNLPIDLRIVFCYYRGRYHLYNNESDKALTNLHAAYQLLIQSKKESAQNINARKILKFLIPVKMLKGEFPTIEEL